MPVSNPTMTNTPTLEKFSRMNSQEFKDTTSQYQEAVSQVTEKVGELVDQGWITSLQGLGIIGCATNQIYATSAFHGQPSFADVWAKWSNGSTSQESRRTTSSN